jgi:tetratricopeptide (TPR) repeat protein
MSRGNPAIAGRGKRALSAAAAAVLLLAGCAGSGEYEAALEEGLLFAQKGNHPAAVGRLEAAVDLEPDEAKPRFHLARSQIRLKRFPDAETNLIALDGEIGLDALESPTDRTEALADLGALELRKALDRGATGSFFKAQGYFERSLTLDPGFVPGLLGKALCLYGLEKYYEPGGGESAFQLFTRCAARGPARPEPVYYLALCNEKDKRLSTIKALALYEKVLALAGDPATLELADVQPSRVFDVAIDALDVSYPLLALDRMIPLLAGLPPADVGLDGAGARARARVWFDLYSKLGGRKPLPQTLIDWMEGTATAAPPGPGPGPGPSGNPPAGPAIRPQMEILAPAARELRTNEKTLAVTAQAADDAGGFALKISLNGKPLTPAFRDLKIEPVDVMGHPGERRTQTFDVPLTEGRNSIVLRVVDREGLASDEIELLVDHRAPAVFAVAAGADAASASGPSLRHAETDARDFTNALAECFSIPPERRVVIAGAEARPGPFLDAVRKAALAAWEGDGIAVYFAGFGATVEGKNGTERFLVFPGFDPQAPQAGGVALSAFGALLAGTRAGKVAIVLDAGFGPGEGEGFRTFPGRAGPPRSWEGSVLSILQIPADIAPRVSVILASDGSGTAVELSPDNPNWRKGGILTTFLLQAIQGRGDAGGMAATAPAEGLLGFVLPRVSYQAIRLGAAQVPMAVGPRDRPWMAR